MNCRSILSGLVGLWGIVSSGGEPAAPAPEFEAVVRAAHTLLGSDCAHDSLRGSEAQKIMQTALDHVTPAAYLLFYRGGLKWTPETLKKFYARHPPFLWYDLAFEKVLREVKTEPVAPGEVKLWLVYNMGYVVKTPTHCFGIDIHHRRATELVPYLEFALVTHDHADHCTREFLAAMNRAGKKIYSGFYPSRSGGGYDGGYSKEKEREIRLADDLTVRTYECDHNVRLPRFVTPFEIVCGTGSDTCVIFSSGDACDAKQLHPRSAKVDFHIVHPRNGLDVRESARDTVRPAVTLISHLLELHHRFDKWRWTFEDGYAAAEKARSVGKTAYVPMWGEKIVWKKDVCK